MNLKRGADPEPPKSADVVVIGSGAGGGTLAFALRHLGARIVVLERGQFLPREAENWDANSVFVDNRYKTNERWLDREGKSYRPGMQYWVGGNTTLFRCAVSERKRGHVIFSESSTGERKILVFPRLERVAPEVSLPHVDIQWNARELESLAELASGQPGKPTKALVRAIRH
jgi:glycine/D-amino acid oxidase-like deaminating enzyme